ncbi:hypothetical protein J6524_04775 [Bradyrhizobium sp. WSM 1738]|uniref:hypothetical protein n=1 Tax=Bradyrhizobium hereditatis TaxID=2821405 RepID=UPI001CE35EFD|nr:hypothetical protein [Bradyrhizobium hereditatis]MCA6114243.1 hypothetical protein [Bradyrhizobium hereditatis]
MAGILDLLTGQAGGPWSLLYPDRLPITDANQASPFDNAAWPAGPRGAPLPVVYPQGGDPMTAGGPVSNGPGLSKPDPAPTTAANIPASWGALYPSSLNAEADQAQQAREAAASVLARRFRAASHAPAPEAAPAPFGAGAVPFGFAGPGSMNVSPADIAPAPAPSPFAGGARPVPFAAGPVTQQPAPRSTEVSSVNRDRAPDDFIPVGDYQMPAFRGGAPAEPAAAPSAAPAVARGAPSSPAPFSLAGNGGGAGDRLMKATRGFMGNMSAGPIGALMGGLGALVTGQNTDPSSIAAEQNSMSARALLAKGATPEEVQAARYNPALMKALIDNYYGKDRWTVVQTGEDDQGRKTFMQQNQVDGTLRPIQGAAAGGSGSSAGDFVTGPGGERIQIPPGVDRKAFIKRITEANADAATGKGTEAQGKAGKFTTIATDAEKVIKNVEAQGQNVWGRLTDNLPMGGAYLQSPEYQKYKAAKEAFIGAHLRDVSGAAIGTPEYVRAEKTFFPQPGEGPEVVRQKAALRANLIETMRREAGPGFKPPTAGAATGKTSSGITWSVQ